MKKTSGNFAAPTTTGTQRKPAKEKQRAKPRRLKKNSFGRFSRLKEVRSFKIEEQNQFSGKWNERLFDERKI